MKIFISGIHSGPDPSSGLGVARSLKIAFPQAHLIGVDYSANSSGIHYEGFDDVWVQRPWNEVDLDLYHGQIARVLETGATWISCLDLEALWLTRNFPGEPKLLVPSAIALERIAKPSIIAARYLPVTIPEHASAALPLWDLHTFCRRHGWPVWVKGPVHEAIWAKNWPEVLKSLKHIRDKWAIGQPVLQTHVQGREESIVYSAYQGKMLDCVHMQKSSQTPEGKTWAGTITDAPAAFTELIRKVVSELEWTGGAELEMVRDNRGVLYLIDWNPRFPAWIYGATLAGRNLPGSLLEAAGAGTACPTPCISREFSRVVMELPVRVEYPLPLPAHPGLDAAMSPAKHPSGMILLGKQLRGKQAWAQAPAPDLPDTIFDDLAESGLWFLTTPRRIFLPKTARELFSRTRSLKESMRHSGVSLQISYSVKTNPHPAMMARAHEYGLLAEAITAHEVQHATTYGFTPQAIILNGPAQGWPEEIPSEEPPYAVFADSFERLEALLGMAMRPRYLGLRLRTATVGSRFGFDLTEFGEFTALVTLLKNIKERRPLGVHFHMASDVIGVQSWWELYTAALCWGRTLQERTGWPISCVDVGGGWFPNDFFEELAPRLPQMVQEARSQLPNIETFILEPGKALAQPSMALVTRVLEVRRPRTKSGHVEALIDGAISDLPQAPNYPHRLLAVLRGGEPKILPGGEDRVLGRNCMEFDVLATDVDLPSQLGAGDLLIFCDAGGYDASMAYDFGKGRTNDG